MPLVTKCLCSEGMALEEGSTPCYSFSLERNVGVDLPDFLSPLKAMFFFLRRNQKIIENQAISKNLKCPKIISCIWNPKPVEERNTNSAFTKGGSQSNPQNNPLFFQINEANQPAC